MNFGGEIFCPSSTVEIAANLEGLQNRTVRWGEKDADRGPQRTLRSLGWGENSLDLTALRITKRDIGIIRCHL